MPFINFAKSLPLSQGFYLPLSLSSSKIWTTYMSCLWYCSMVFKYSVLIFLLYFFLSACFSFDNFCWSIFKLIDSSPAMIILLMSPLKEFFISYIMISLLAFLFNYFYSFQIPYTLMCVSAGLFNLKIMVILKFLCDSTSSMIIFQYGCIVYFISWKWFAFPCYCVFVIFMHYTLYVKEDWDN